MLRQPLSPYVAAVVVGLALLLAACGYSGSPSAKMRSWMSASSFTSNEKQVLADLRSLARAASSGSGKQMRTVCGGLSTDAGTLYGTLPTPDHPLTSELGASMSDFFTGAERCAVAGSARTRLARRGFAEIRTGLVQLRRAAATLRHLGVHSPRVPKVTVA